MNLLGKPLHTRNELISEINHRLGIGTLDLRMFSYYKDVRDMIPKPIRIKTKGGQSGANSYYTDDTLEYVNELMREYSSGTKTLKEIQEEWGPKIEEHIIKSDIFRYKCEVYLKYKKAIESSTKELVQSFGNVSLEFKKTPMPGYLNKGMEDTLNQALKALGKNTSEDKLDSLFEKLLFVYYQRLKYRMKEKVLEEKEGR